jgi:hypothetical protein
VAQYFICKTVSLTFVHENEWFTEIRGFTLAIGSQDEPSAQMGQ